MTRSHNDEGATDVAAALIGTGSADMLRGECLQAVRKFYGTMTNASTAFVVDDDGQNAQQLLQDGSEMSMSNMTRDLGKEHGPITKLLNLPHCLTSIDSFLLCMTSHYRIILVQRIEILQ